MTKKSYYFKPDTVGIYYGFSIWLSNAGYLGSKKNDTINFPELLWIVTYKPLGKYKNKYIDPTETLIEIFALYNDYKLPELAFVGLDTVEVKKKLGDNFLRKNSCFIYTKDKNALTLKIKGKTVEWLKWTRLNISLSVDSIPIGLLTDKI